MKLRWFPHVYNEQPIFVFCEFIDPTNDPFKIKFWGQVVYVPEIDSYGATYYTKDRQHRGADKPFDSIYEAMQAVEQQLFEEGVRDDTDQENTNDEYSLPADNGEVF